LVVANIVVIGSVLTAHADIFQWEYINPADPNQGKQQSTTLAPDGAGVDAVPGADLSGRNLTMAYLIGVDLSSIYSCHFGIFCSWETTNLSDTNLTNADLSSADLSWASLWDTNLRGANVTNADFSSATLTNADFTGADVRGARFGWPRSGYGTGISLAQLYSTASYQARDLSRIDLSYNDLTGANFVGQNLTNADFVNTALTDADFAGAEVQEANFGNGDGTGITLAQLYSTASYHQAKDLSGTSLLGNFAGGNFVGFNLTNAGLGFGITDADFTQAEVRGASLRGITLAQLYSTASYQAHDLTGIGLSGDLSGANFAGQNLTKASFALATLTGTNFNRANLTNVDFSYAPLTDAGFAGADVRGASFARGRQYNDGPVVGGITLAQLYSTASYAAHDLSGIRVDLNDLSGAGLAGQNLSNAFFGQANLTGANLRGANLANAQFYTYYYSCPGLAACFPGYSYASAALTDADLTGADTRGASGLDASDAITANLIKPDGHISGLDLGAGNLLVVRDYDGNPGDVSGSLIPPIPITIDQHLTMGPGGTLRLVFEADAWDSTISFAPGIPVTLGGTLEFTFAADVNLASQLKRTFDLVNWTGVTPTGTFAISSPYAWDLSNLYTTGEVTLIAVPEPASIVFVAAAAFRGRHLRRRNRGQRPLLQFICCVELNNSCKGEIR
jgi:uncharacterized protein YjbI with pentapeptide repeats